MLMQRPHATLLLLLLFACGIVHPAVTAQLNEPVSTGHPLFDSSAIRSQRRTNDSRQPQPHARKLHQSVPSEHRLPLVTVAELDADGIPSTFLWEEYLSMYPDVLEFLSDADEEGARMHYMKFGMREGRLPRLPPMVLQYTVCGTAIGAHARVRCCVRTVPLQSKCIPTCTHGWWLHGWVPGVWSRLASSAPRPTRGTWRQQSPCSTSMPQCWPHAEYAWPCRRCAVSITVRTLRAAAPCCTTGAGVGLAHHPRQRPRGVQLPRHHPCWIRRCTLTMR